MLLLVGLLMVIYEMHGCSLVPGHILSPSLEICTPMAVNVIKRAIKVIPEIKYMRLYCSAIIRDPPLPKYS